MCHLRYVGLTWESSIFFKCQPVLTEPALSYLPNETEFFIENLLTIPRITSDLYLSSYVYQNQQSFRLFWCSMLYFWKNHYRLAHGRLSKIPQNPIYNDGILGTLLGMFLFSFIGNSTLRWTLRERPLRDRVWTHIESRQFIGWWRDAISDAMTSSAHTGEHAIHSSDFSAFTKRSHYPSLLRFLTQLTFLRSPSALRRLPQWNFVLLAVKCHGISPLSTAVRTIHRSLWPAQISKIICFGFTHAVYGIWR